MRLVLRLIIIGILLLLFIIILLIKNYSTEKSLQEIEDDKAIQLLESLPDDAQASAGLVNKLDHQSPPLSLNIAVILIVSLLTIALLITGICC